MTVSIALRALPPTVLAMACCCALMGCADDGPTDTGGSAPEATDAGARDTLQRSDFEQDSGSLPEVSDDTPDAGCPTPCLPPAEQCQDSICVCADGYHDGGDGVCVEAHRCSDGFGMASGDSDCRALESVCPPRSACEVAVDWSDGVCEYAPAQDGTACEVTSGNPCALDYACQSSSCQPVLPECSEAPRPVVFVHGVNGSSENFATMIDRLVEDGWPPEYLVAFDAEDPSWGCNVDNAAAIAELVESVRNDTCESRVDMVAHSMGTISSRYYMKNLGGHEVVNTYVTLGGMNQGLFYPCLAPDFLDVCIWQELCEWGELIEQLNDPPATPGDVHWVSIYGSEDDAVPNDSSYLDGAENILIEGAEHDGENGLLERQDVYEEVRRVLRYPCW